MPLEPTLSLTLPSFHDSLLLECRLYHPPSLIFTCSQAPPWRRHSAVFAHPYGPLGGSYDDHIVKVTVASLLREGYLVATFNFRGSGKSQGRTSWTGKPEIRDYMSVIGFLFHYITHLDPFQESTLTPSVSPLAAVFEDALPQPVMLLGGYSYGSLITMQLPPLFEILQVFDETSAKDAVIMDIITRARDLANYQTALISSQFESANPASGVKSPRRSLGMRVGRADGNIRRSIDGRRSLSQDAEERIRKALSDVRTRIAHKASSMASLTNSPGLTNEGEAPKPLTKETTMADERSKSAPPDTLKSGQFLPIERRVSLNPRAAYLLISPLQGPISHLAAMPLKPITLWGRTPNQIHSDNAAQAKLWLQETMAVFGDVDVFVTVAKLRSWTNKMASKPESRFTGYEITGAGHFWNEEGALDELVVLTRQFAKRLVDYKIQKV